MKKGKIIPILALVLMVSVSGCIKIVPSESGVSGEGGGTGGLIAIDIEGPVLDDGLGGDDSSGDGDDGGIAAGDVETSGPEGTSTDQAPQQTEAKTDSVLVTVSAHIDSELGKSQAGMEASPADEKEVLKDLNPISSP